MARYWSGLVMFARVMAFFVLSALILTLLALGLPGLVSSAWAATSGSDRKEHARQAGNCRDVIKGLARGNSAVAAEAVGRGAAPENAEDRRDKMREIIRAIVALTEGSFLKARKPLPDVATQGGPVVVREVWTYASNLDVVMGCVRYRNAQGWRTDLELGNNADTVTRNLTRQVRDNAASVSLRN